MALMWAAHSNGSGLVMHLPRPSPAEGLILPVAVIFASFGPKVKKRWNAWRNMASPGEGGREIFIFLYSFLLFGDRGDLHKT